MLRISSSYKGFMYNITKHIQIYTLCAGKLITNTWILKKNKKLIFESFVTHKCLLNFCFALGLQKQTLTQRDV